MRRGRGVALKLECVWSFYFSAERLSPQWFMFYAAASSPFVLNVRCLSVINEIALLLFCSASAAFAFLYLHFLLHFVPCLLLLLLLCVGMPRLLWLKSLSALGFYLASHGLLFEMVCLAVRVLATEHCQLVFETPIMGHTNTNCRPTFDCWPKVNSQLLMTVRTPQGSLYI